MDDIKALFGGPRVNRRDESGVNVEKLLPEIEALHGAAHRFVEAHDKGAAGLQLEALAIQYVRKLDEEVRLSRRIDYVAIARESQRSVRDRDN